MHTFSKWIELLQWIFQKFISPQTKHENVNIHPYWHTRPYTPNSSIIIHLFHYIAAQGCVLYFFYVCIIIIAIAVEYVIYWNLLGVLACHRPKNRVRFSSLPQSLHPLTPTSFNETFKWFVTLLLAHLLCTYHQFKAFYMHMRACMRLLNMHKIFCTISNRKPVSTQWRISSFHYLNFICIFNFHTENYLGHEAQTNFHLNFHIAIYQLRLVVHKNLPFYSIRFTVGDNY